MQRTRLLGTTRLDRDNRLSRRRRLAVILTSGLLLTGVASASTFLHERADWRHLFEQRADRWLDTLQSALEQNQWAIEFLSHQIQHVPLLDERRYADLVSPVLERHREIEVIAWAEYVDGQQPDLFLEGMRVRHNNEFEIVEPDLKGGWSRAPRRSAYYPVTHVQPDSMRNVLLGFTPTAPGPHARALNRTLTQRTASVTERLIALTGPQAGPGVLLFSPVFFETSNPQQLRHATGVIIVSYRFERLLARLFPDGADELTPYIFDATSTPTLLYSGNPSHPRGGLELRGLRQADIAADVSVSRMIEFGGRDWQFVITPSAAMHARDLPQASVVVFLTGALLTLLIAVPAARRHKHKREVQRESGTWQPERSAVREPSESTERVVSLKAPERDLIENAPDVLVYLSAPKATIEYASPAAAEVLGVAPGALVGRSMFEFMHPEDVYREKRSFARALASPGVYCVSHRIRKPDGGFTWVESMSRVVVGDHADQPAKVIAILREPARRQPELIALRASEALYRAAFEMAPSPMALVAPGTLRLIRVNQAFCALLGYTKDELRDVDVRQITHPADRSLVPRVFAPRPVYGYPVFRCRKRYLSKAGNSIWVDVFAAPLRDSDGNPRQSVVLVQEADAGHQHADFVAPALSGAGP